jgi:hypothetical protein
MENSGNYIITNDAYRLIDITNGLEVIKDDDNSSTFDYIYSKYYTEASKITGLTQNYLMRSLQTGDKVMVLKPISEVTPSSKETVSQDTIKQVINIVGTKLNALGIAVNLIDANTMAELRGVKKNAKAFILNG